MTMKKYKAYAYKLLPGRSGMVIHWTGVIEGPGWDRRFCPHNHFSKAAALKCAEKELERVKRFRSWR